ncbi:hypothetical protein RHSIM_RhsimUnG0059100 [Rhododendron simsii]|uniref:BZIP domain-containing protein n=1 Tax=Rhododendron simsii TaxID=118357 RepID=A0A834FVU0_RHOSS|nr:hypothetical protein RHSIM_RhsimUnG0059100 [Rhododendron simsii]
MGSSETNKPKEPKTPSALASSTPTGTTNPDWSGFQAYSPMPPPGFLASSPQAHPYMWGVQHIMPPYGTTPHPYVAVYPHGGIYAHPSIPPGSYPFSPFPVPSPNGVAEASGNTLSSMETDGKLSEGREKLPIKRSKKSLSSSNTVSGKNNGLGKTSGALANGVCSRSAESASEHSSEGSDADSQNVGLTNEVGIRARFFGRFGSEASQNSGAIYGSQNGGPNTSPTMVNHTMAIMPPCVPGPTTNLNIGMDYWGAGPIAGGMITAGSRESIQSQPWPQQNRVQNQRSNGSPDEIKLSSKGLRTATGPQIARQKGYFAADGGRLGLGDDRLKAGGGRLESGGADWSQLEVDMEFQLGGGRRYWGGLGFEVFQRFQGVSMLKMTSGSYGGGRHAMDGSDIRVFLSRYLINIIGFLSPGVQDERELKRQRRKQSNRESARRSRLRKQTECDELALRTEVLNEENATLRTDLSRIRSEYEQLLTENASLKVRRDLGRLLGKKILGLVGISIQLAYGYASRAFAECYNVLLSGLCIGTWKVEAMRGLNSSGICHLNGLLPIAEGLLEEANELLGEMVGEDHTPNALVIF